MTQTIDVLGLGTVTIDELAFVSRYPAPDGKVAIIKRTRQCGGLTGTALVAAARLGAHCAYAGNLAEEELSEFILQSFRKEGVNTDLVRRRPNARPLYCFIVIDQERQTRNIFFDNNTVVGPDLDWPSSDVIRSVGVLLIDYYAIDQMIRAATIARAAGVPVVADFEEDPGGRFAELLQLTDHLILSLDFSRRLTGLSKPLEVAQALWHDERQVVALTAGAAGCWYLAADAPRVLRHQPAFAVQVADTTGCGDVFHGAYAFGLARGWDVGQRMRFAAATAALKAEHTGGQAGIPTADKVNAFLRERAAEHTHLSTKAT